MNFETLIYQTEKCPINKDSTHLNVEKNSQYTSTKAFLMIQTKDSRTLQFQSDSDILIITPEKKGNKYN